MRKFIVIEGGEGSGKDTQIELLKKSFAGRDDILFTREPGGTALGQKIREIVQDKNLSIAPEVDIDLYIADRRQHMVEVVIPALKSGKVVISNRFDLSTIAYQIFGRKRLDLFRHFRIKNSEAVGMYIPDLYILLDVNPETGLARKRAIGEGATRFESRDLSFHNRVRAGYLKHLPDSPRGVLVDGSLGTEAVHEAVISALEKVGLTL